MSAPVQRGRRRFLAAAGALGVLALGGIGIGLAPARLDALQVRWVERLVRDHLPGADIDAASLSAFATEFVQARPALRDTTPWSVAGWSRLAALLGVRLPRTDAATQLERAAITEFLTGSNFFEGGSPTRERIVYVGRPSVCGNVFARFRAD